ncbi:MAG: P1 family peptidase [Armatimonadota bacterium]|nr:P1 family peptidase [Armatimonadota bacterium]MDR7449041.1 P1 family peptidase [Armatimonadota bacterium]MDR7459451.1 P1 family peptidase [Armatimonadota bacterium]MDR7480184.1 P1 family peptidase [Armatimonadota bacterium]MDR7488540.1 P1 family peptidase [Armatimonadota bacterium]
MSDHEGLTAVPGIRVGHATDRDGGTGCTVVLCEAGALAAGEVRGWAPGTRETDLLRPGMLVEQVHAVLLTGGSAFGLAATDGVVRWLEERGVGFDAGVARVPIVPAAVLFDLAVGRADARPTPEMAYAACLAATDGPVAEGRVGAGTGATVGKLLGPAGAMPGGVGTVALRLAGDVRVAALAVVNAFGDVRDPHTGRIVAGARLPDGRFLDTAAALLTWEGDLTFGRPGTSTTLVVVATDALLTRDEATRVAAQAHDGLARAVSPAHTLFDGDAVFVLSTGRGRAHPLAVAAAAAEATARAIVRAVQAAARA